jgi:hypothetical protein
MPQDTRDALEVLEFELNFLGKGAVAVCGVMPLFRGICDSRP